MIFLCKYSKQLLKEHVHSRSFKNQRSREHGDIINYIECAYPSSVVKRIDFSYNGAWDTHIKKLIQNGKQKVNQRNSIISKPLH